MANPNPPPDPPPPALSAAELRRRLLASTPPPIAPSTASGTVDFDTAPDPQQPSGSMSWGSGDVLSRLRLPGQVVPASPASAGDVDEHTAPPAPHAAINKRTPITGVRLPAMDPASVALGHAAVNYGLPPDRATGSGSQRMPQPRMPVDSSAAGSGAQRVSSSRDDGSPAAEAQRLRNENKELRQLLEEMKHLLQEASDTEQQYAVKAQQLQIALTEKQRQADELSSQLQSIEEQLASGMLAPSQPIPQAKTRTEIEEWADELEKESAKLAQDRKRLEADRLQLRDDEEALEKQMRDMEVGMARERALMARQETELKRLSAEIQHELELMQRGDASLREQMVKFQRRAQDVMQGRVGQSGAGGQSSMNLGVPPPKR